MCKWLSALIVMLPMVFANVRAADDPAALVGTWKVVSYEVEFQDTGERRTPLGASPTGYIVFTPEGRFIVYMEAKDRKTLRTDQQRVTAYETMVAYTGKYRIKDDRWITKVDGAWNVEWVGSEQERLFSVHGSRLEVIAQWNPNPLFDRRMTRGHLTAEREK